MENLVKKDNGNNYYVSNETYYIGMYGCLGGMVVDKLAEYENTGFTPSEVVELKEANKVLSNELTKNTIIKQDCILTCCGIPLGEIPKLKQENNQLKQQLAEKEELLKNAICTKFKIGDK